MEIEKLRKEAARWMMLRIIDAGRPIGVNEAIIARVLADLQLPFTRDQLRRELAYLRDLGLIEIGGDSDWFAKTTGRGVDVVEYVEAAPPGVARPEKC